MTGTAEALLALLKEPKTKQKDIVPLYAGIIDELDKLTNQEISEINNAISDKWSLRGWRSIKRLAWKNYDAIHRIGPKWNY